ncbi:DUF397 domain-containing protein [Streptomyces jietaisiensis]|uniref:DUF397 domain-containing protein n=1 Tax=Streptomyces griseoaurantiacus TaxID=68213 RepID=A0ABZ1V345_9ACTN|nr:DUF397 domain-containing protein [Streptomyces jietaisiensis]
MNFEDTADELTPLVWFKSSYSGAQGGECVEVATRCGAIRVRDSKDTARAGLVVGEDAWKGFIRFAAER